MGAIHKGLIKKGEVRNPTGRPKGKKGDKWLVIEQLEKQGFDLISALIKTARGQVEFDWEVDLTVDKKAERIDWARGKLLDRVSPALKAVEISTDSESPVLFNFNIPLLNIKTDDKNDS